MTDYLFDRLYQALKIKTDFLGLVNSKIILIRGYELRIMSDSVEGSELLC